MPALGDTSRVLTRPHHNPESVFTMEMLIIHVQFSLFKRQTIHKRSETAASFHVDHSVNLALPLSHPGQLAISTSSTLDLNSRCRESRTSVPRVEFQGAASRGPMWRRRESNPLGTKLKPNFLEFGAFIDPSGQNQLYHTPLLSKIGIETKW